MKRLGTVVMVVLLLGATALLSAAPVAAQTRRITRSYAIGVSCTSTLADRSCSPPYEQPVTTTKVLQLEFVANPAHCTPIEIGFLPVVPGLGGDWYGWFVLDPGESTGVVDLGPVPHRASGRVEVWARDAPGGPCPDDPLSAWEGTLKVTTSKHVRR